MDELHIDGSPQLAVRQCWWRAQRRMLAEEHAWRHEHGPAWRPGVWYPTECQPRDSVEARRILRTEASADRRERAQEIATVYRALRKGREDSKDEPGAADSYYGEMEMRRKAAGSSVERMLLTGYWLLSGYGLRAWRALTALVVLLAVSTALFATVASHPPEFGYRRVPPPPGNPSTFGYEATTELRSRPPWTTALDYSVQSPASLVRPLQNQPALTGWGERWRSSCG